ncbi:signal peptidase I [Desulfobacula sp.]|uniref:signal peptidase I n=1 Tax=Desulfobacula sp. TaxID=2593537 RepID=UPI0025BF496D|nr:signal peptidase I [Desulfobacula sp.]
MVKERIDEPFCRSDLVAIVFGHRQAPLIKRAVAVPGDRVKIKNNRLFINKIYSGPVNQKKMRSTIKQLARYNGVIPPGNLFVLGDNLKNSRDSRRLGLIPFDLVKGKASKIIRSQQL